jgi:uncharacterized membrane protein YphA (DoxX/SURF4 family)
MLTTAAAPANESVTAEIVRESRGDLCTTGPWGGFSLGYCGPVWPLREKCRLWKFRELRAVHGPVNSFMPAFTIRFLAWTATVAELLLGLALVFGLWIRWTSLASAVLLAVFGIAMAISFGFKSPLDYAVFSASAAALLLALDQATGIRVHSRKRLYRNVISRCEELHAFTRSHLAQCAFRVV